jgi:hypothetical protein
VFAPEEEEEEEEETCPVAARVEVRGRFEDLEEQR